MIKMTEARSLTEQYNIEKLRNQKTEVYNYCNGEVSKAIQEAATNGKENIKISIPTNLNVDLVLTYLNNNGFTCSKLTHNYILIEWC